MVSWLRRQLARRVLARLDMSSFYGALPRVQPGYGGYTEQQRFADFRAVFYGESSPEQGQRVYQQIIDFCEGPESSRAEIDSHAALASREGARRVGRTIARWANCEPAVKQEQTRNERHGG